MAEGNYVKADDEGEEFITVYDTFGTTHQTVWYADHGGKGRARVFAKELAAEVAAKIGTDWGTNW